MTPGVGACREAAVLQGTRRLAFTCHDGPLQSVIARSLQSGCNVSDRRRRPSEGNRTTGEVNASPPNYTQPLGSPHCLMLPVARYSDCPRGGPDETERSPHA